MKCTKIFIWKRRSTETAIAIGMIMLLISTKIQQNRVSNNIDDNNNINIIIDKTLQLLPSRMQI